MNITLFVIGCVLFAVSFVIWNIIGHPIGPDMRGHRPTPKEYVQPQYKLVNIISAIGMIIGLAILLFSIVCFIIG